MRYFDRSKKKEQEVIQRTVQDEPISKDKKEYIPHAIASRVQWWERSSNYTYNGQKQALYAATDVLEVFRKYFPIASTTSFTLAEAHIKSKAYGLGYVPLKGMDINDVLEVLNSRLVRKLLIHKFKAEEENTSLLMDQIPTDYSLSIGQYSIEERMNTVGFLGISVDATQIQIPSSIDNYFISSLPEVPLKIRLAIGPANYQNKLLKHEIEKEILYIFQNFPSSWFDSE